ncbi:MAG: 4Fe-4S binding protein [Comamonadaceae bacterium]|nr:4Fe-4S binding protein [Comamonadaceae bacterium]
MATKRQSRKVAREVAGSQPRLHGLRARETPRTTRPEAGSAQRPIWDNAKCIKCGICYIFCPEACIQEVTDGFFEANLDYCKGCGICAHECWPGAIVMVEEEE